MPTLIDGPVRRLAGAMADLRDRVRAAVAGEVARAMGEAVKDIVAAAMRGSSPPDAGPVSCQHHPRGGWDDPDPDPDPWADRPDWRDDDADPDVWADPAEVAPAVHKTPGDPTPTNPPPAAPAAVAAGLAAGRWWLRQRGSVLEAVGVGLLVGLATWIGGPAARAGADVALIAADLSAAAAALGAGADRWKRL